MGCRKSPFVIPNPAPVCEDGGEGPASFSRPQEEKVDPSGKNR